MALNIHNGISLGRGCRQGDSVSFLFVLAAESSAESIRQNSNVEGLNIYGKEYRVSQYADNTTLYIKQKYEYLAECVYTLEKFAQNSRLRIIVKKNKNYSGWGVKRQQEILP